MMSKVTGLSIALLILTAVVSASTLVTYNILKLKENESNLRPKVDFAEGTNHYTLIEVDEGDNDEEKQVTLILHEFVFSVTGELDTVNWDFGDGNSGTNGAIISHQYDEPGTYGYSNDFFP